MDYLLPTVDGVPRLGAGRDGDPVAAPPDRRQGRRRVGHGGSPAAVVNAVIDALSPFGVRHADMPLTPANVWRAIQGNPVRVDMAVE